MKNRTYFLHGIASVSPKNRFGASEGRSLAGLQPRRLFSMKRSGPSWTESPNEGSHETTEIQINQMTFQVDSVNEVHRPVNIKFILTQNHLGKKTGTLRFRWSAEQAQTTKNDVSFYGAIAAISLAVAALEYEYYARNGHGRRGEIGIRRALVCEKSDLRGNFLRNHCCCRYLEESRGFLGGLLCGPVTEVIDFL